MYESELLSNIVVRLNNEIDKCIAGTISSNLKDYNIDINIEKIIETLKDADRYRWHDLNSNPEDLPINGSLVLCKQGNNYFVTEYSKDLGFFDGLMDFVPITAWQYIKVYEDS